ncbi:MAG TPA: PAS domain-containing sensor histidine kinase [Saprospiraceae bacterium]|nr:PAS domain-containing sensor histidine kinase [Saprospiraceae bacterium]HPI07383.1 PAS domain-containing sensor histidine kinase [Saprospiraceae bacterium]
MFTLQSDTRWSKLVWLLVVAVFIGDLLLPKQFNIVFAYLLAHFMAIFFKEKGDVFLLAVITTTLTILAVFFKPQEAPLEEILFERFPPIVSFWAAAFFVVRYINLRETEQQQEGRFKALFEYATNGILMTTRRGNIIMANPALEKLFGYGSGELTDLQVEKLIPRRFAEHHEENRANFHQNPHPRNMGTGLNLSGLRKDGTEFPVEVSLSPFKNREGEFVVAFVVDNTYRKNYEDSIIHQKLELATLSEALQESNEGLENKVAERTRQLEKAKDELAAALDKERELGELKSRFVSMASHEFRTPLTSVLSSAGLVHQYADRQDITSVKKHADRIKNAVNGLNTILTEFLSLGRLEEGRIQASLEEIDIPANIEELHNEMKNLFKNGQTLEYTHEGARKAMLDGGLLKNILINLISNAMKYSLENMPIIVHSRIDSEGVFISVRDKGLGIPEHEQKHLFERFFRATNATNIQGTGLGLYIVQRYAEMMNGEVGFTSAVEEGSEFWVKFPL